MNVTSILSAMRPGQLDDYAARADEDAENGVPGAVERGELAASAARGMKRPLAAEPKGAA